MKIVSSILVIVFLFFGFNYNSNSQDVLSNENKKVIKSIKSQAFNVGMSRNDTLTFKIENDIENYVKEFNKNGLIEWEYQYFYDKKSVALNYIYDNNDLLKKKIIYKLKDSAKILDTIIEYGYNDKKLDSEYKYDSNDNLIKIVKYDYNKNGYSSYEYFYGKFDEKGNNKLIKYNSLEQIISIERNWKDGKYLDREYFYYNEANLLDSTITFANDKKLYEEIYQYNESEMSIKYYNYYSNTDKILINEERYNSNKEIISIINNENTDLKNGNKYFQYVYDENGNWIKKLESNKNSLEKIVKREIEYYD